MRSLHHRISHARVLIDTMTAMLAQVQLHSRFFIRYTRQLLQRMTNLKLTFFSKTIKPVTSVKDLGDILDSHLTSNDCHI